MQWLHEILRPSFERQITSATSGVRAAEAPGILFHLYTGSLICEWLMMSSVVNPVVHSALQTNSRLQGSDFQGQLKTPH